MAGSIKHTACVVDASFILGALLPDEHTAEIDAVITRFVSGNLQFISSHLLPFEVLNGLKAAIMRKRVTPQIARELASHFLAWDIRYEEVDFLDTFALAVKKTISVYDASYLTLAHDLKLPFFSFDKHLMKNQFIG